MNTRGAALRALAGAGLSFCALCGAAAAQPADTDFPDADQRIATHILNEVQTADAADFGALVARIAHDPAFAQARYAEHPLDQDSANDGTEHLLAGFARFDCETFVETVLALARAAALQQKSAADFAQQLAALRYRGGEVSWCARLHYFSDWIAQNQARGAVAEITGSLVTSTVWRALPQGLDYLSRHAAATPGLADDPEHLACVRAAEQRLSAALPRRGGVRGFFYLPAAHLAEFANAIQPGDVLALVGRSEGLDFTHLAIALPGGAMAHASETHGEVRVVRSLAAYLRAHPAFVGLRVIRPLDPRKQQ